MREPVQMHHAVITVSHAWGIFDICLDYAYVNYFCSFAAIALLRFHDENPAILFNIKALPLEKQTVKGYIVNIVVLMVIFDLFVFVIKSHYTVASYTVNIYFT